MTGLDHSWLFLGAGHTIHWEHQAISWLHLQTIMIPMTNEHGGPSQGWHILTTTYTPPVPTTATDFWALSSYLCSAGHRAKCLGPEYKDHKIEFLTWRAVSSRHITCTGLWCQSTESNTVDPNSEGRITSQDRLGYNKETNNPSDFFIPPYVALMVDRRFYSMAAWSHQNSVWWRTRYLDNTEIEGKRAQEGFELAIEFLAQKWNVWLPYNPLAKTGHVAQFNLREPGSEIVPYVRRQRSRGIWWAV